MADSVATSSLTLGIIGGGQLARMLAPPAMRLGCKVAVLEKTPSSPGGLAASIELTGDWRKVEACMELAAISDVVTVENEFVDASILAAIEEAGTPVFPSSATIRTVQDKWTQKSALAAAGLPVAPMALAPTPDAIAEAATHWGWPLVLKTRRDGYDGKGNATLRSADDISTAWESLGGTDGKPLYLEKFCHFARELATIVTRGKDGSSVTYPLVETVQRDHICHIVRAPASADDALTNQALSMARAAIDAIGGIGSFGVEMFVTDSGEVWINELAPRVHNSGHYTIEACECSQFENHVRAILGLPLGSSRMVRPAAVMVNLLGHGPGNGHPTGMLHALSIPGAHVHLYGKARSAKGRKMGHITALGDSLQEAEGLAAAAATALQFGNPT